MTDPRPPDVMMFPPTTPSDPIAIRGEDRRNGDEMSAPDHDDRVDPGGWIVEVTVPNSTGKPLIVWNFLAYEADRDKAIQLVRRCAPVLEDEIAEPIAQLPAHVFATLGIRPGQVERHDW